jgi:D-serine deaminase-like pyridoxal phosphate-dependent protein
MPTGSSGISPAGRPTATRWAREPPARQDGSLGQQVSIVPNHACVVANLFDELVVVGEGRAPTPWRIDARGRSR